ncbi:TRAF-type zinc finger domain-containing protein 1-like isoform X2 [Pecten maximus]|uniref:TRAF-type zinc finger domain-containing protein 1-like isoform X2 n=1 Tax=Pecten maximus TaxID=6579 RepID=UPI0014591AC8|nr:TRAF-type zinc finger domain-containing protein 1-like isoform X2 [Pecten maximus]
MAESATLDTKFCSNCKREINAANFMMHEMHCRRHISLCTHCQEPIPKAEMDVHFEESHAKINCAKCNQAVQKMDLEKHEEQECPKRQMKCAYCEMDVAQQELEAHLGYCGTRTEPCARCGQYIMIKDQVKHEDSNCTYPQPKPTNSREVNRRVSNEPTGNGEEIGAAFPDDMLFGSGNINSFEFKEIQRILTKPEISGAAEGPSTLGSRHRETEKTKKATGKKSNDKNKKSDLNRLREQASSSQSGSAYNEEQDRLLAMALSDDLHTDDGIDQYIRTIDKPRVSLTPDSPLYEDSFGNPANLHSSFGDLSVLPCEFCGQAIPVDDLVIHQSNCIDDPLSSLMPHAASSETPIQDRTEDNRFRGAAPETRHPPPIINNLVPDASPPQQWFEQMISPEEEGFAEDFLLPCEFCEELFPHEILVQHQAVCTANETVTPRVTPSMTRKTDPSNRRQPTVDETSRVRKRQPAPDIASILSESPDNRRKQTGTSSRTSSNNLPVHSQRLKSTLEKYGVAADDPYKQRAERRALRQQNSHEEDEDESPRPRTGKSGAKRGLAAKSTLDSLLQVDPPSSVRSTHDLLGHVTSTSSTRKSSKDNLNSSRQTRQIGIPSVSNPGARSSHKYDVNTSSLLYGDTSSDAAAASRRSRGSVTARDVQQELDHQPSSRSTLGTYNIAGARRARNSQASEDIMASGIRTTSTTPGSARRDRGNGIFSHGQANTSSSTTTRSNRTPARTTRRDRDPYH